MSQLYTPLSLSRKIASLGVECESEKWHCPCGEHLVNVRCGSSNPAHNDGDFATSDVVTYLPAYSLGELPPVLQAIGAVKGWGEHTELFKEENAPWNNSEKKTPMWQYHFLEIARLYLDSKEKAFSYLEDLLN